MPHLAILCAYALWAAEGVKHSIYRGPTIPCWTLRP
jgi:hypothetical protein